MFDIDVRLLGIVKGVLFVDIFEVALIDVFMVARKVDVVVVEIGLLVEVVMVLVVEVNFVDVVVEIGLVSSLNVVVGQTSLKLPFRNIIK